MRVFAGPNGSGKSTIIHAVQEYKVNGILVDFGIYVNADDILQNLLDGKFSFRPFQITTTDEKFTEEALTSGLITNAFSKSSFKRIYSFESNQIKLKSKKGSDRLAQIIAHFVRKELLRQRKKFSFETVFSHSSKLDIMREASDAGYKVYLYFVATEDPIINKFRVNIRVKQGGHPVPADKIESRYYRSLGQLFEAAQLAYQCFFFDNSSDGQDFRLVAHFKVIGNEKKWDKIDHDKVPNWFIKYYSDEVAKSK